MPYFCKKIMLLFEVGFVELQGIATVIIFGLLFYLLTELRSIQASLKTGQPGAPAGNGQLALQAYERLSLLTDRVSLKHLVTRMHTPGLTVRELQAGMVETIRAEFEHNITQQMYIKAEVWKAITNMKDQNMFIINQLAAGLPPEADGLDLSKKILSYSDNNNAELGQMVLDAIRYEVKKLI